MLLAIVGFMILYKISAPMNMLRTAILTGCIAGLLFCSIFLNDLFAITGMTTKCIMLFIVFAIATEPVLRYLTILTEKIRSFYSGLRSRRQKKSKKKTVCEEKIKILTLQAVLFKKVRQTY